MKLKRLDPSVGSSLLTVGVIAAAGLLLSLITIVPSGNGTTIAAGSGNGGGGGAITGTGDGGGGGTDAGGGGGGGTQGGGGGSSAAGKAGSQVGGAAAAAQCAAGKNGGSSATGVSANSVKLGATVVADGPGSSFLGPVRIGMTAVVDAVNRAGGVCGRRLSLELRNDSWDATTGCRYIQDFVESDKVFALAVVPSSEGVRACDSYIKTQGVPVVGSDGMLIHQYRNPWIWPVATSTISTMHVMAKNAYDRGARNFGLVFDAKYHFGVEGAYAFNAAVKRLTGSDILGYDSSLKSCTKQFCGIQPGKPSYAGEAQTFNGACYQSGTKTCDFVAFLLEPDTAVSFFREGRPADPAMGKDGGFGLAQPLFTRSLAEDCKSVCDGMWVWTGYNPPIEALAATKPVLGYVNAIRGESNSADTSNQFLEGGYLGMNLLVNALQKVGPNLTRANLKSVLDGTTYDSGLASPLTWSPGNHFANTSAQAFSIQYKETFSGWRQKTPFISDPWVGQDIPPGELT
jgi:ABC-type branched-subunit amino acid transport system substrate-binding protein